MFGVMSVRLWLEGVRVLGVAVDDRERLEVEVESSREWSRCPQCGFKCHRVSVSAGEAGEGLGGERPPDDAVVAPAAVRVRQLWGAAHREP